MEPSLITNELPDLSRVAVTIDAMRNELYHKKVVHIHEDTMVRVMQFFGATQQDMDELQWIFTDDTKRRDPVHHKYINSRKHLFRKETDEEDPEKTWKTHKLPPHTAVEMDDSEFVKANFGLSFRPYGSLPDWVLHNTAFNALMKFLLHNAKPTTQAVRDQGFNWNPSLTRDEQDPQVFQYVLETYAQQVEGLPEDFAEQGKSRKLSASPEGIHQDGADVTFILMHSLENVDVEHPYDESHGGVSRFYQLHKTYAVNDHGSVISPGDIRGFHEDLHNTKLGDMDQHLMPGFRPIRLTHQWEGILALDMETMHEARGSIQPLDPTIPARRNIISLLARRTHINGSDDVILRNAVNFDDEQGEQIAIACPELRDLFEMDTEFFAHWKKLKQLAEDVSQKELQQKVEELRVKTVPRVQMIRKDPFNERYMVEYKEHIQSIQELVASTGGARPIQFW